MLFMGVLSLGMLQRNDRFQAIVSPPAALRGTGGPGEQPVTTRETPAGATLLRFSAGSQGGPHHHLPAETKINGLMIQNRK